MSQNKAERNKIPGKFYPLQHSEMLRAGQELTPNQEREV